MFPATLLLLGSVTFLEQDLSGVREGWVARVSSEAARIVCPADLDGDGAVDLIFRDGVNFQRDGRFDSAPRIPLPDLGARYDCDLWEADLYCRTVEGLGIRRWDRKKGWVAIVNQKMAWPPGAVVQADLAKGTADTAGSVDLTRFLYDMNGDKVPELVVPAEDGLHIYSRGKEGYKESARLVVFPPPRRINTPRAHLWPAAARQLSFPHERAHCVFFVKGNELTVVAREEAGDDLLRWRTTRYRLDPLRNYAIISADTREELSGPLPHCAAPCRLNNDDVIDYAGAEWEETTSSMFPKPVLETVASTDGGKTLQVRRTLSFRPTCSFADIDGDGDHDMITERTGLFDGGIRETVARYMTSRRIRHEINVYHQTTDGFFPVTPELSYRFTIELDQPPYHDSDRFRRYLSGELVNVTGDFDGDGRRDLLVHDRPDRLVLHLGTGHTFSKGPAATVVVPSGCTWVVEDVDADGRSDLLVWWTVLDGEIEREQSRVYLARGKAL
jgi:hypothetical protein